MWAGYARKARGFLAYWTMKRVDTSTTLSVSPERSRRTNFKDQYFSVYEWETKQAHKRFMQRYHDWLVSKSRAKVKVLGYYNLKSIDEIR